MKTYILSLGLALLSFGFTAQAGDGCCKKADCCKNCTDEKCKTTCQKVSTMSAEQLATEEGKNLLAECAELCSKNGCCKTDSQNCSKDGKKACCKK